MSLAARTAVFFPAALGWVLLLLATGWSLRAVREPGAAASLGWKWWGLAAAILVCFRWPLLWITHPLNPDESQLIAGALTLRHDPVFWRSVDGATAGPLDYYPLLPAAWADGYASYAVSRLIALAVVFASVVFVGEALALTAGAALARVALLPALAAAGFTTDPDFAHYSTELMPGLLLAAAGYAAVRQGRAPAPRWPWLTGLLLGAVPWAKLQAAPIAAVLWALVAVREYRAGRARSLTPLVIGALLPALACLSLAVLTRQTEHLIVPYILRNFAYVGAPQFSWWASAAGQWQNALSDGYLAFWLVGTGFFVAGLGFRRSRTVPAAALLLFAVGVFSALAPRRPSAHHLQLMVLPLLWLAGAALTLRWRPEATPAAARNRLLMAGLFLGCGLLPQMALRAGGFDPFAAINSAGVNPARQELVALVRAYSNPGEPLAVWGWRCALYVEAGRPQATRQAQTEAQIYPSTLQPYFLRRYLEDFQAANPPVFADAVGPGNFAYVNRERAHESFPPLRAWVRARYTLVADLDGTRLFVRNDRLDAVKAVPPGQP